MGFFSDFFGSDEKAPVGPDWHKFMNGMTKFAETHKDLFTEALKTGNLNITKGQEFVDSINKFGMDASGSLNAFADATGQVFDTRIGKLGEAGDAYATANQEIYNTNQALAGQLTGALMPGVTGQAELGQDLRSRYEAEGIPFQDEYLAKLKGWDTTGRREAEAGRAVGDISMATEQARESELRRLESYGVDPGQTRSAALDSRIQAQNAVSKAAAANEARRRVEGEGLAYGKVASDMYDKSLADAGTLSEGATRQGAVTQGIGMAPGAQYMTGLGNLANYNLGVGQLEQAGKGLTYDMKSGASRLGLDALSTAGGLQQDVNRYSSSVIGQAADINRQGADMRTGAYTTAGGLHGGDLAAHESNMANSPAAGLGRMFGAAAPIAASIFGGPAGAAAWGAVSGAAGGLGGGGAAPAAAPRAPAAPMAPMQSNPWLSGIYNEPDPTRKLYEKGGDVPLSASPSRGAIPDDVPAALQAGEYIVDRDTVAWYGKKYFKGLQDKAKKDMGAIPA